MVRESPCASQVLGYRRRSAQCQPRLLFLPHGLAHDQTASRLHREEEEDTTRRSLG